jgi:hypothetical protein
MNFDNNFYGEMYIMLHEVYILPSKSAHTFHSATKGRIYLTCFIPNIGAALASDKPGKETKIRHTVEVKLSTLLTSTPIVMSGQFYNVLLTPGERTCSAD